MEITTLASLASFLKFIPPVAHFLYTPQIKVLTGDGDSFFGWTNNKQNFALILTMEFTNISKNPYFVKNLLVYFQGATCEPINLAGGTNLSLSGKDVSRTRRVDDKTSILKTPQIPPMDRVERWALFHLPTPETEFPLSLNFNVGAQYPFSRNKIISAELKTRVA